MLTTHNCLSLSDSRAVISIFIFVVAFRLNTTSQKMCAARTQVRLKFAHRSGRNFRFYVNTRENYIDVHKLGIHTDIEVKGCTECYNGTLCHPRLSAKTESNWIMYFHFVSGENYLLSLCLKLSVSPFFWFAWLLAVLDVCSKDSLISNLGLKIQDHVILLSMPHIP